MLTAGHCGLRSFFNNGNFFGNTRRNFNNDSLSQDVQTLGGLPYASNVWVNQNPGSSEQPTLRNVGGAFASPPAVGSQVTFDGFVSKMFRHNSVVSNNACTHFDGAPPGVNFCRLGATPLYSYEGGPFPKPIDQGGDSGGPVFCYECYPNVVTPAGLIEGASPGDNLAFFTFIGDDLALTQSNIY